MTDITIHPSKEQIFLHDQVRSGFEWMTVTVSLRPHNERLGMALSISSSFGTFSHEYHSIASGPHLDPEAAARDFLVKTGHRAEGFVDRLLPGDQDVLDYETSLAAARKLLSEHLESLCPNGSEAQDLREAILNFEDAVEDICGNWGEEYCAIQLLDQTGLWNIFPDTAHEIIVRKPSPRRMQALAMHEKLWQPYVKSLEIPYSDIS